MKKVKAEEIVTWFSGAAGDGPESGGRPDYWRRPVVQGTSESGDFEIEKPGGFQRIGAQPSA